MLSHSSSQNMLNRPSFEDMNTLVLRHGSADVLLPISLPKPEHLVQSVEINLAEQETWKKGDQAYQALFLTSRLERVLKTSKQAAAENSL